MARHPIKLLFLDFDGVLNTNASREDNPIGFYPDLVMNLAEVLRRTGAYFVVSSSWRLDPMGLGITSDFQGGLRRVGDLLHDPTLAPLVISRMHGATVDAPMPREEQVLLYARDTRPSVYVAVDDDLSLFPSNPDWLVLTDPDQGLDEHTRDRLIGVLGVMPDLNPGIAKTVQWLQSHGFRTTDSGDGETHLYACDRDYPYVVMSVDPADMVEEADRLLNLCLEAGLPMGEMSMGEMSMEQTSLSIQATYDPTNKLAFIDLMGVSDKILPLRGI